MRKTRDLLWNGRFKWPKRILCCCAVLGILGVTAILCISSYVIRSTSDRVVSDTGTIAGEVDCILVLGAGLRDGKPSLVLRDRLDRAIELYQAGVSDRILMTGDHGRKDYDEVAVMKQYAMDAGIPAEHVFMDHAGFSTYESMYRARDVFQVKRIAVVTQPYHIYRSLYIAGSLGLEACGTPSKATQYRNSWMLEVREKLARTKDFFKVMIEPEPTYLGEPVPVIGNVSTQAVDE